MTEYIKGLRKFVGHAPLIQCGATMIIFDSQHRVLMMHRIDNDCWCFPGGSVELGEDVRTTAIREAFEETGLTVENAKLFDVFSGKDLYYKYPNGDEVYNIDNVFVSNKYTGKLIEANEESKGCSFFNLNDLPGKVSPPQIPIVKKLLNMHEEIVF